MSQKEKISGLRSQAAYEPTLLTSTGQTKSVCKPLNSPSPFCPFPSLHFNLFSLQTRHSSCDFYPSFPLSLFYSLFLLLRPSRPSTLRRRAGCRRRTGPWRQRWTGRPRAPWQTTPGRCSWRGASPLLSGSGSNRRPRLSRPGGPQAGRGREDTIRSSTEPKFWRGKDNVRSCRMFRLFL